VFVAATFLRHALPGFQETGISTCPALLTIMPRM
jgi:hypothetical protein